MGCLFCGAFKVAFVFVLEFVYVFILMVGLGLVGVCSLLLLVWFNLFLV